MGRKLGVLVLVLFLLLITGSLSEDTEVESIVFEQVEDLTKVSVIVEVEKAPEDLNWIEKRFAADVELSQLDEGIYVAEVDEAGLEDLIEDPNVIAVKEDGLAELFLSDSVPLVNASIVHSLQNGALNITGKDQGICIIDSGINYTQPGLAGRIVAQQCYCDVTDLGGGGCCPDQTNEQTNASDDHGHGTHVSGIAAGNGSVIVGVAPEANIVAVKVTNESGSALFSDIEQAVEFCVTNRNVYNISVISMSLGGGSFSAECDSNYSSLASDINSAFSNNVSVVVATGNSASTSGIASPSCITNTISVSSTEKDDDISTFSNRNSITDMMAPGTSITSTATSGSSNCASSSSTSKSCSGTSMAAPHVAGAVALLQQYKQDVESRNLSATEVNNTLGSNGTEIDDSAGSGKIFYRLNVRTSLTAVDELAPNMSNPNTTSTTHYVYNNITFLVNTSDVNLQAVTLEANWSGTAVNYTMANDVGDLFNYTIGNDSFDSGQTFQWRVHSNDTINNVNTSDWFEINVLTGAPTITVHAPANSLYSNNASLEFNLTAIDDVDTQFNCSVFLDGVINQTNTTTLNNTVTTFQIQNIAEATHNWYFSCNDSEGLALNSSTLNFTIDTTNPNIVNQTFTSLFELGDNLSYSIDATDTHLTYVNFSYDGVNYTMTNSSASYFYHNFTTYLNGSNNFTVYAYDTAGNFNATNNTFLAQDNITGPRVVNLNFDDSLTSGAEQFIQSYIVNNISIHTAIFSLAGTNYTMANNTYYNYTYNFTAATCGTNSFSVWANDTKGDAVYNTSSFEVTSCCGDGTCSDSESCSSCSSDCGTCATSSSSSSGGGGGGSGGGGSSAASDSRSNKVTKVIGGGSPTEPLEVSVSSESIPVSNIEIQLHAEVSNVKVTVEALGAKPSEVSEPSGEVFDYISIYLTNFGNDQVAEAYIDFEVDRNWVSENNIDYETVVLQRFDSAWSELSTSFENSDSDYYYYQALSPGFSYFAISGETSVEEIEEDVEDQIAEVFDEVTGDVPSEAPSDDRREPFRVLVVIAVIIAILASIVMLTYWLKRSKDNV